MLGWLLCKLGVHDTKEGGCNWFPDMPGPMSIWGYCTRPKCTFSWQFDN